MMGYGAGLGSGIGFGGLLTVLGCILLVVGAVVLIAWAIGRLGETSQPPAAQATRGGSGDAGEVLRLRFARGEITSDEFLAARQTLETER